MLGMMHFAGYGASQNYNKAIQWFELSCKNGWSYAQARMGLVYELGYGVKTDHEKSELWYGQLFAREEELRPKNDKLFHLFGDEKFKIDFSEVNKKTNQIATTTVDANTTSLPRTMMRYRLTGSEAIGECIFWSMMSNPFHCIPASQYEFASMQNRIYNDMHGIKNDCINDTKAFKWIKKAAENGNMDAQDYLDRNYENGIIVEKSYVEALKWFQASHVHGNPEVLYSIGSLYFYGHDSVKRDLIKAFNTFQELLKMGLGDHAEACHKIGTLHEVRIPGVLEQNFKKAFEYFKKAADIGLALGFANTGVYYMEGRSGVPKDDKKAFDCLPTAADMNCAQGQYGLGTMFMFGCNVKVDLDRALKLFKKARDNGFAEAQGAIDMAKKTKLPSKTVGIFSLCNHDYEKFIDIIGDTESTEDLECAEDTEKKTKKKKKKSKGKKKAKLTEEFQTLST